MQAALSGVCLDYVKQHGGRVTTGVSGKTSYLVMGSELEDGRPTEEGSKYKKAKEQPEKTTLLSNEGDLFGLVKMLNGVGAPAASVPAPSAASSVSSSASNPCAKKAPANPYAAKNPYAKAGAPAAAAPGNPYASKLKPSNPYGGGGAAANPYAKSSSSTTSSVGGAPRPAADPAGGGRASIDDR